ALGSARGDEVAEAMAHFTRGNTHYAVGEFAEAAEEYQAAYKLKPVSAFLFDAAQAYRFAGNYKKALVLYRNYVIFYPNERNVEDVKAQIVKLKAAIATRTSPPAGTTAPPPATPAPPTSAS